MFKAPITGYFSCISIIAAFLSIGAAFAQQRPPTVTNVSPSELRLPSQDETGLWQLLSHQNDPEEICGSGKTLAVIVRTGQVVCASLMRKECHSVTKALEQGYNKAQKRADKIKASLRQKLSSHRKVVSQINAANIKDKNFTRQANQTKDTDTQLDILEQQLEHKNETLELIRERDKLDGEIDQLEEERRQALEDVANAENNLATAKRSNIECSQRDEPSGWLARRHRKGLEYAVENETVRELIEDVLLKQAMINSGAPRNAADIAMAIKAQVDRIDYAQENGLDTRFWRESAAEITETILVQTIPGMDHKLTASKIATAFGTAYIYGFAVGK